MNGTGAEFPFPIGQTALMLIFPMIRRLLKTSSLIVLGCLPALLSAQETTGKEEERLATLARNEGEWTAPKTKLSIGFRMLNSGGTVNFSNLGVVPSIRTIAPISAGAATQVYDNGIVFLDSARSNERAADGTQVSIPNGRYQVIQVSTDGSSLVVEDSISFTPGLTREWETHTATQFGRPGHASFSNYSATSAGGTASSEQGAIGGMEFQITRDLGRSSRTFQWSLMAGITLNDINGKSAGTVTSSLNIHTDYYAYTLPFGQPAPTGAYVASNYTELLDSNGVLVNPFGYETSATLNAVSDPAQSTDQVAGAVSVTGNWQVKGSYFLLRFGPSLRAKLSDRFGLSASVGLAGAYAGTRYSAYEYFSNPANSDELIENSSADAPLSDETTEFIGGFYADLNLDFSANETVGIFGGVTAQQLGEYEQKLGDRSARIDLGSAYGIRGGVTIKF